MKLHRLSHPHLRSYACFLFIIAALVFDMEYARWLEDHQRQINELRSALNSQANNEDLRLLVESVMSHYNEVFRLKSIGTKSDVFHILSGMWTTPAERCFMWLGGFRSSELLKVLNIKETIYTQVVE